jgi:hypothetical protein
MRGKVNMFAWGGELELIPIKSHLPWFLSVVLLIRKACEIS